MDDVVNCYRKKILNQTDDFRVLIQHQVLLFDKEKF